MRRSMGASRPSGQLGADRAVRRPPGAAGLPAARTRRTRLEATTAYWRSWAATHLRRPVARRGDPQRAGAEAAVPRPLRGDRGGGDRLAPRADRGRAQLGLPLLLGARLGLHAGGPAAPRLPGRGRGVLLVAAPRIAADPPAPAGALPPRRRRARARANAGAGRLSGLAAGSDRQRGRRAEPARHLRRPAADRPDLRAGRRAARPRDRPAAGRDRRPRLPDLAPARLRHLGGAQRAPALHALQDDVLGRARPRASPVRRAATSPGHASTWRREALAIRDFIETRCWSQRLGSYTRHAGGRSSTPACCSGVLLGYAARDPGRLTATVDALRRELGRAAALPLQRRGRPARRARAPSSAARSGSPTRWPVSAGSTRPPN